MPAAYSSDLRERVVYHYKNTDSTLKKAAEIFQIGISTLRVYIQLDEEGDLSPKKYKRGRKKVISDGKLEQVKLWVMKDHAIQLKKLCEKFQKRYNIKVSLSMMCRALQELNLTRKKRSHFAAEQLRPEVKEKREEHVIKYQNINVDQLIFIDETGITLNMVLDYARSLIGTRIAMPKPCNQGAKFTLIGAISTKCIEAALYGQWAANTEIFQNFIEQFLAPKLTKKHTVIMDNVAFHKSKGVIDAIESTGAKVDFLPPYSPELNPIELMWSFIKNIIRTHAPRNKKELAKILKFALEQVDKKKLRGWFSHAGYS